MVSHPEILDGEGWTWVDKIEHTCSEATITTSTTTSSSTTSTTTDNTAITSSTALDNSMYFPGVILPTFIHYCQDYIADAYAFHKRDVPTNMLHCNTTTNTSNNDKGNNGNILLLRDPDSLIYSGDLNKLNLTGEVSHMYLPL